VDCGLLWRLQSFPCRYPIPACVCTPTRAPDLRSLAHRCILDSWIAGSASNVRSPAAHSASTTVDSFACISSARIQRIQKGGLPQNNRRRKDAFCSAAHNGPGPIHAGLENWKRLFSTPRTKQVQGWKSRTHERRPVPTLTGASQQPGGVFLPILLQPGHTLFKVLQTNRSSC
jgi:hypothetical protein